MLESIKLICHSSIVIEKGKKIYIDPFKIDQNYNDADVIYITHSHYDHFSPKDIEKVKKEDTFIIATQDLKSKIINLGFKNEKTILVEPNEEYNVLDIIFKTIPSYNIDKSFHIRSNNWVGYILKIDGVSYYIAGDTDVTKENKKVKCDIAFIPIRRNIYNEF